MTGKIFSCNKKIEIEFSFVKVQISTFNLTRKTGSGQYPDPVLPFNKPVYSLGLASAASSSSPNSSAATAAASAARSISGSSSGGRLREL